MEWYKPEKAYTDARLTKTDKRNIKMVVSAEKKHGGPMTEAQQEEQHWMEMA